MLQVVGVRDAVGRPVHDLFKGQLKVVEKLLICAIQLTFGRKERNQSCDSADNQSRLAFTVCKGYLAPFSVIDVDQQMQPPLDRTRLVPQRQTQYVMPPINAVGAKVAASTL